MATTNINKIVRGNLNFKPWIGSKNTTEIVNSYVQKFYKQIPNDFKSDLMKPRMLGIPKTENRFPFRKVVPEKCSIPIISHAPTSKLRANGYRSPAMTAKNSFVSSPKKFLKTPNFKIYTRRRYASSVSSSKSSFVRNKPNANEEYRKKIYTPAQGVQFQTFRGSETMPCTKYYDTSVISKLIPPKRLVNESNHRSKTVEISNAICSDLMSIDDVLKRKICMKKPKSTNVEPLETPKQNLLDLSFKGWNHPSTEHYKKLTIAPVIRKPEKASRGSVNALSGGHSSFRLMPVKRKTDTTRVPILSPAPRKTKLQSSDSSYYKGFNSMSGGGPKKQTTTQNTPYFGSYDRYNSRFQTLKMDEPEKDKSDLKSYGTRDPLDFVCLSRAERRERSRYQERFEGNLRF